MSFCAKCGGTGVLLNGTPCECSIGIQDVYSDVACLDIPEQYRNVHFQPELIHDSWAGSYIKFMSELHTALSTMAEKCHNYLICSPPMHSKSILAYTTISRLFRKSIKVFPLYDALELKTKIMLYDQGRPNNKVDEDFELFFTAPYVFVRIPAMLNADVFQTCALILDRRVRRGCSTIFIFNGTWERLQAADVYENFSSYKGDGNYCTYSVHSWREVKKNEAQDLH